LNYSLFDWLLSDYVDKNNKTRKIEIIYNFIGAVNPTAPVKNTSKSRLLGTVITTLS
jgi:hypothetical protein